MDIDKRVDEDGTITYGADDTEHLLSSEPNRMRLLSAIARLDERPESKSRGCYGY